MTQNNNLDVAKEVCGADASVYLANKHRGGKAGGEGVQFETWYAIYNAAKLVRETLLNGLPEPVLWTQTMDYVDDFVISWNEESHYQHFQLKNTENISWTAGAHPIAEDFRLQKLLNEGVGIRSTSTTLVLPGNKKAATLQTSIPENISAFSSVEQFAFGATLNHVLQIEPKLHRALADLCINSDYDKVERLGSLFVGAWVSKSGNACNLKEIWNDVLQHEPNYIKIPSEVDIPEKFSQLLMQIKGFSYTMVNGVFEWSYLESDSGTFEHSLNSKEFLNFQFTIIANAPSTFEDLERYLI